MLLSSTRPAFSAPPPIAATTRDVASTKPPAKAIKTVVLRPANARRVRSVSRDVRRGPPSRRVARPLQSVPPPSQEAAPPRRRSKEVPNSREVEERASVKAAEPKKKAEETIAVHEVADLEKAVEKDAESGMEEVNGNDVNNGVNIDTSVSDLRSRSGSDTNRATTDKTKTRATDLEEKQRISQEEARTAFLDEQLSQRQAELEAKRAKKKPLKRVRPASAVARKSVVALKDTFKAYMDEISREQLLGQSEVIDLATQIRQGVQVENVQRQMESKLRRRPSILEIAQKLRIDANEVQRRRMAGTAAKNTLVAANLRLVTSVARKVALTKGNGTAGIALDDMVQEGSVGLIRAAEKFDASKGYKFSTYATWWIRAYVMRSITTQSRSIKVPSTIVDEYARIRKEYNRLRENGIFRPADEEVAEALGITTAKLRFVVNVVTRVPASLDVKLDAGDPTNSRSLGEVVEGDDDVEERMVEDLQRRELDIALRRYLRPMERAAIRLRFGLEDGQPRTLRETGELLGLSKERIRQLVFRALPKMKTPEIQRMLTDATAR